MVIEVHAPSAALRKSYGVGPAAVPPDSTGSSAMSLGGPASMSLRSERAERTITGRISSPHSQKDWCSHRPPPLDGAERHPIPRVRIARERDAGQDAVHVAAEGIPKRRRQLDGHDVA